MILYQKLQEGTSGNQYFEQPHQRVIFDNAREAQEYMDALDIQEHFANDDPNITIRTRCTGSALDSCKEYNWRAGWNTVPPPTNVRELTPNQSVDAWEVHDLVRQLGTGQDGSGIALNQLPLYTLIGTGDAREKYIQPNQQKYPRHTISVIGWTVDGTPLLYSMGVVLDGSRFTIAKDNLVTIPTKHTMSFQEAMEEEYRKYHGDEPITPWFKYKDYVKSLRASGIDVSDRFEEDLSEFIDGIRENEKYIMKDTGLTKSAFNKLFKLAVALATQETGTVGSLGMFIDSFGDSDGLAQLKTSNISPLIERYPTATRNANPIKAYMNSDKLPKPRDLENNKLNGVYTMLLLADNLKRLNTVKARASKANDKTITEVDRSLGPYQKKLVSFLGLDSYNKTYPTSGNNPDLTDEQYIMYMWNSPGRLRHNDASGTDNAYIQNVSRFLGLANAFTENR